MTDEEDLRPSDQESISAEALAASSNEEITHWLSQLRQGESRAHSALWQDYFLKLVALARQRLATLPRREMDEEDVALSALHSFHRAVVANKFPKLNDRHDLWKILVTITTRKVMAQRKRHFAEKRGHGKVRGESVFQQQAAQEDGRRGIEQIFGTEPSPEMVVTLAEQCETLFSQLNELLKPIALLKVEGYTNLEIAEQLDLSLRTVERRLESIRIIWSRHAAESSSLPK